MPVYRQRREKPRNLVLAHLQRMTLAMEQDNPLDPADVRFLRPYAVVPHTDGLLHLIKQLGLVSYRSVRDVDNTLECPMRSRDTPLINTQPLWEQPRTSLTPASASRNTSCVRIPDSHGRTLLGGLFGRPPLLPLPQVWSAWA